MADLRSFVIRNVIDGEMSSRWPAVEIPGEGDPLILNHIVGIQDCYIWWDEEREGWVIQGGDDG